MSGFRRIVTGHDANGRSIVISDGPSTDTMGSLINFWAIPSVPADYNAPDPCVPGKPMGLEPPPGGVKFRFFQIQPDKAVANVPRD